ncbi:uncharacterized protein [Lepisosteus oculatus]|uniref:uncharacterized protein isoform X3 n=1 Tax=Lepisosteus oculatus TaxID=7918 RepID=UPI0035F51987
MITPFLAAGPMNREPAQCRPPPTEEGRGGLPRTPTWPPVCLSVRGERGPQAAPAAADMTVPAGPAVLVALLLTRDLVAGSIATAPVRPGGNVTLRCDIPLQYETLWFVQRPNATPAMGVAVSKSLRGGLVHRGPDPRLTGELDATAGSVRLRIRDVGEADLAMYYCADRVGGRLVVGNGTRLVFPGGGRSTDLEEEEEVDRSCTLCWSLLASVLLLGVLGSSAWVYWCRRQKGPGSAGEPGGGRASAERRRGAGTAQDDDDDDEALNYATLQIQGGPKRPRSKPPQRAESSLYSEVEHRRRM